MREIRADYSETFLLPPALEDWVPANHPARFVRELVDGLDLAGLGFTVRRTEEGRPNYASDLLLKVWLYGYLSGIRQLRGLERACRENMGLIWLTGRHDPDHNTLWRFFRDNREALRRLFKQVVRLAAQQELVGVVLHAVDGTKVKAAGSRDSVKNKKQIDQALEELEESVERVISEIEQSVSEDGGANYALPEGWREKALSREQLRELQARLECEERETIHPLDREAEMTKTRSQGTTLAYNGQLVVDGGGCGLIVGAEVVGDCSDRRQLVAMIAEVEENLGQAAETTVADGGYYTGAELKRAKERGYGVLVNERHADGEEEGRGEYDATRFTYDKEKDRLTCPQGKELRFERVDTGGKRLRDEARRVYRCKECGSCPVRAKCTTDKRGRSVKLSVFYELAKEQRELRMSDRGRELLRRRKAIVEGPIGIIKEILGFRRFTVWRIEAVRTQWAIVCTAFNLRKLVDQWKAGRFKMVALVRA